MISKFVASVCLLTLLGAACANSNEVDRSSDPVDSTTTTARIDDTAAASPTSGESSDNAASPSTTTSDAGGPGSDSTSEGTGADSTREGTATDSTPEGTGSDSTSEGTGADATSEGTRSTSTPEGTNQIETADGNLASSFEEEIGKLIEATERIRGLEFLEPPNVVLLTPEDFNRRLQGALEDDLREIEVGGELYKLLGLLDEEDSLEELYREMLIGGVSGYYDGDTTELVMPIKGDALSVYDRMVLVHELVHALTDQHFKFSELADQLDDEDKDDALAALSALIEGDARRMEESYFENELSPAEQYELAITPIDELLELEGSDSSIRREFPHFLVEAISFPYVFGLTFAKQLAVRGGLEAINAAYKNPPISTEQIHSHRSYPDEVPLEVSHQVVDVPGYELEHSSTWGEAGFAIMFDQALGTQSYANSRNRRGAVRGWGGDRYSFWSNGEEAAFALTYRGDEVSDAQELFETMQEYVSAVMDVGAPEVSEREATWQGADFAWLNLSGDEVKFIAASDPEVGDYLLTTYGDLGTAVPSASPASTPPPGGAENSERDERDSSGVRAREVRASTPENGADLRVGEATASLVVNLENEEALAAYQEDLGREPASPSREPSPPPAASGAEPASPSAGEPPSPPSSSGAEPVSPSRGPSSPPTASTTEPVSDTEPSSNTESGQANEQANEVAQEDEPAEDDPTETEPTEAEPTETDENLRALFETQIAELIETTERIRGLEFQESPNITLLTIDSFRERIQGSAQNWFTGLEADEALMKLLGLLEKNASLAQLHRDLFTGSVAGFYSSANRELVVPLRGEKLGVYDRIILFHELIHALTDQHFNFWERIVKLSRETKHDAGRAMRALIEGDASIFQSYYIRNELTSADIIEFNNTVLELQSSASDLSGIPHFISEGFSFQYTFGRIFVNSILEEGGIEAIDAAYGSPPITSEQIFFPQKYPDDIPLEIEHPVVDIPGYRLADSSTWGALNFAMMFDQVFAPWETEEDEIGHRRKSVEGWGSDTYSLWFNDSDAVFTLTYRGDTPQDAEEFAYTMREYIPFAMAVGNPYISGNTTTWQADDFAWLSISGDEVQFVAASDPEVADIILASYETP